MASIDKNKLSNEIKSKYIIKNNTFSNIQKADKKDLIEIEIGDGKQVDFKPQFKLMRWDNEVNFSLRLKDGVDNSTSPENDLNVLKWISNKREAHFYDKPEMGEDGGFEFEVLLKEKPKSNKIEFSIRSKGLDFFYQPELTEQEKRDGNIRPDNVIGSYAVYHKTKKDNHTNGKHYKTGKAFHILRPKIIDSKGDWVWGELNIDVKKQDLTIIVPQKFLDNGVYPIIVDPTFGYTTAGFSETARQAGYAHLSKGTPVSGGDVDSISFYGRKLIGDNNLKGAIWLESDSSLLTNSVTPTFSLTNTTRQWYTINYSTSPEIIASTNYYIGIIHQLTSPNTYFSWDGATDEGGEDANNYTTPTDLGTIESTSRRYSVYATYTAGSAPETKTKTVSAKTRVQKTSLKTISSKLRVTSSTETIDKTVLVSPTNTSSGSNPTVFVWTIPSNNQNNPMHAHIQVDEIDNSFANLEIEQESFNDNNNMEYWNGSAWITYPLTGVVSTYYGNQARLTVTLTGGVKYWRVRGGSKL